MGVSLVYFVFTFIYLGLCVVCGCKCHGAHREVKGQLSRESVPSFHHMAPRHWTQVVKPCWKHIYPLSHFVSPGFELFSYVTRAIHLWRFRMVQSYNRTQGTTSIVLLLAQSRPVTTLPYAGYKLRGWCRSSRTWPPLFSAEASPPHKQRLDCTSSSPRQAPLITLLSTQTLAKTNHCVNKNL